MKRNVEESRETRWDTSVACVMMTNPSSLGCQIEASHHKMGMVTKIMT